MKTKEFINIVNKLLHSKLNEFEFMYHTPESYFLYVFRNRHYGDFNNYQRKGSINRYRIWKMVRSSEKTPITMELTNISTVLTRKMLIEVANVVIDEVNDSLKNRYGKRANLYEHVVDPIW